MSHVTILGAGAFGRALGQVAARRGTQVVVWTRRPDVPLPEGLQRAATLQEAVAPSQLLFFCAPAAHARPLLRALGDVAHGGHFLVHAARGLEPCDEGGLPVSEIVRQETPIRRIGVLAGPLVPEELAAAIPSAIVVASRFPEVSQAAQEALAQEALRVYASDDLLGVEYSAALMTVLALAAGLATGLGGGVSTRSLVITRGLAESGRLLEALGGRVRTLVGLGGIGEVFVTAQGIESPDYHLGVALAQGATADSVRTRLGRSSEGPQMARLAAQLAAAKKVRAPLFHAIAEIVDGKPPRETLSALIGGSAPTEI